MQVGTRQPFRGLDLENRHAVDTASFDA
jgi:hypothetical protein